MLSVSMTTAHPDLIQSEWIPLKTLKLHFAVLFTVHTEQSHSEVGACTSDALSPTHHNHTSHLQPTWPTHRDRQKRLHFMGSDHWNNATLAQIACTPYVTWQ